MNPQEITILNVHKKIVKIEQVVAEKSYFVENINFRKDFLNSFYKECIDNKLNAYTAEMEKINEDLSIYYNKILVVLENNFTNSYLEVNKSFSAFMDEILTQNNKFILEKNEEIKSLNEEISKILNDFIEITEYFNKITIENMKQKIEEIEEHYSEEKEKTDNEIKEKMENLQSKEGLRGYEILKSYEAMIKELTLKMNVKEKKDSFKVSVLKNLRDCTLLLKDWINDMRKKIFGIQSVSGSNITGFIKRSHKIIDDYKKMRQEQKQAANELKEEINMVETMNEREINQLLEEKDINETDFLSEYDTLQSNLDEIKKRQEKEYKDLESKFMPSMVNGNNDINATKAAFDEEEKDFESAAKIAHDSATKKKKELCKIIEQMKEKNEFLIKNEREDALMESEERGVEMDQIVIRNQREFNELQEFYKNEIEKKKKELEEGRESFKAYTALLNDKETLIEKNLALNDLLKEDNDNKEKDLQEAFNKNVIQRILDEESAAQAAFEEMLKNSANKFDEECDLFKKKEEENLEKEKQQIKEKYQKLEGKAEEDQSNYYQSLVEEYKNISVPSNSEKQMEEEIHNLIVQKKECQCTIINQRQDLIHIFSNDLMREDERYQASLISSVKTESNNLDEPQKLREEFEKKMETLEEEIKKLAKTFQENIPKTEIETGSVESSEEINALRNEIRQLMKQREQQIIDKEEEIAKAIEEDKKNNEEKIISVQNEVENEEIKKKEKQEMRENQIKAMENSVLENRNLSTKKVDFEIKSFEKKKENIERNSKTQMSAISSQIDTFNEATEAKKKTAKEEEEEMRIRLDDEAFNYSMTVENKLCAIREKRNAFKEHYDKIVGERMGALNAIKEAYRNRPCGEKEKEVLTNLTSEKEYLEKISNLEAKTAKRYYNIKKDQEENFNARFGNKLCIKGYGNKLRVRSCLWHKK